MDFGALFLLVILLTIVVLFIMAPFTEHWRMQLDQGRRVSSLLAERDRILNAIQELDFDKTLGKIPGDVYPAQRAALLQEGAKVLRQLDEIQKSQQAAAGQRPGNGTSKYRTDATTAPARQLTDEELEDLIAKRLSIRKEKTTGFCPKCGKPILQSDRFCPSCGQALDK